MSNPVPEGWKVTPLENILYRPLAYGVLKPGVNVKNGVPVVRIQDIRGNRLNFDGLYKISSELHREFRRTKLNKGDLIISLVGTIGKTFVVPESLQDANVTRAFGVIGVQESVSPEYVTQWLNSDSSQQWIQDQSQGNAQKVLNLGALKQFPLQLPPLPEQQKIAAILSSVDDVIEKTRAQIDKLKDLKTGMMQELLTKGIGHTEFKDSPVGRIPKAWSVLPLSELVSRDRPITYGIVQTGENLPKGIPCVRVVDLMRPDLSTRDMIRTSKKISDQYKRTLLQKGDIMFALRGEIGHVRLTDASLVGANLTRGVALISPNNTTMPRYLLWALRSPAVRSSIMDGVNGSALQEIPLGNLRNVPIPVPPAEEQARLTDTLDALEQSKTESERKLYTYRNLKKALMQDLLTGKVRVNIDHKESAVA